MESVKGKVAIVTGAAQGIGHAMARILLQNGAKVCLADINAEKGAAVTQLLQQEFGKDSAIFAKCDVTCEADFAKVFLKTKTTFGGLDIVCNNAGILNESEWKQSIEINLTAVVRGTMLAVENMSLDKGGKGGVVVNTASGAGLNDAAQHGALPVYCATKYGVVAFTRSMAANKWFTDKGLRVNCLCPVVVDTDLIKLSDKQVYGGQAGFDQACRNMGLAILPASRVAEALLQVVQDNSLNGAAMIINESGTEIAESK